MLQPKAPTPLPDRGKTELPLTQAALLPVAPSTSCPPSLPSLREPEALTLIFITETSCQKKSLGK